MQNTFRLDQSNCDDDLNQEQYHGRWTTEEHQKFIEALKLYGKSWKKVEEYIGTRTGAQIRSHAQKFFNRIQKLGREQVKLPNAQDENNNQSIKGYPEEYPNSQQSQLKDVQSNIINNSLDKKKKKENKKLRQQNKSYEVKALKNQNDNKLPIIEFSEAVFNCSMDSDKVCIFPEETSLMQTLLLNLIKNNLTQKQITMIEEDCPFESQNESSFEQQMSSCASEKMNFQSPNSLKQNTNLLYTNNFDNQMQYHKQQSQVSNGNYYQNDGLIHYLQNSLQQDSNFPPQDSLLMSSDKTIQKRKIQFDSN